jgi:hypothetical protein
MVARSVENSGNANSVGRGTKVDDVAADGETAELPCREFDAKFSHFRLRRENLARLINQVQEGIGTPPTAALSSDVLADFDQIATRVRGDFKPTHRYFQFLGRFPSPAHGRLDLFDIQRYAFAALELLDAAVDIADQLFPTPQEFDRSVEGLAAIVVHAN